jgi:ATP-dependent Clp protease ATP-binding subunit ClpA
VQAVATLHVRNVPDELYERLRRQAERNGRSIGGEVMVMLQALLTAPTVQPQFGTRRRRSEPKAPFEHFSPRAREVVLDAREEARRLGHDAIGTEHLLLGLLHEAKVAIAFDAIGLDLDRAREAVERVAGRGETPAEAQLPFNSAAKKAFELALRESLRLRHDSLGPEHILCGVLEVDDALGASIVAEHEPAFDRVRSNVFAIAASSSASLRFGGDQFKVVELDGAPPEWESELNEAAERGYQLVQIIDRRAIFRRPW